MIKGSDGNLAPASWEDALVTVAKILDSTPSDKIAAVAGGLVDAEVFKSSLCMIFTLIFPVSDGSQGSPQQAWK